MICLKTPLHRWRLHKAACDALCCLCFHSFNNGTLFVQPLHANVLLLPLFSLHVSFSNWLLHFRSSKQTSHLPPISFQLRWAQMSCRHLQQREAKARPLRKVCPCLFHSFCLDDTHNTTRTNIHIRSLTAECVTVCVAGCSWCSGGVRLGAALWITLFF